MSFTVRKSNGSTLVEVLDQTINRTETSLALCGRGASNYGQAFAENWFHLLENFAHTQPPRRPTTGQLWYDTDESKLKLFNGASWTYLDGTATSGGSGGIHAATADQADVADFATVAGRWAQGRTLTLSGAIQGQVTFDGSQNITLTTSLVGSSGLNAATADFATIAATATNANYATSSGTATSANRLTTARKITLQGAVAGEANFDGTQDITITTTGGGLEDAGVVAGSYAYAAITVDAKGRITAASSGEAGTGGVGPHGHPISDITGLQAALDGKSNLGHTHSASEISGLQIILDGKSDSDHGHTISEVTGLQAALDGKAAVDHTHADYAPLVPAHNAVGSYTVAGGFATTVADGTEITSGFFPVPPGTWRVCGQGWPSGGGFFGGEGAPTYSHMIVRIA